MCYCFCADRTQIFNKAQKHFSISEFNMLCGVVVILGVLSIRRCVGSPASKYPSSVHRNNQLFLSRDQTDEWKGWMQFLILIYHYTGASKVLRIYEGVRLLVASYLFMTGYGHTLSFYTKGDYSLQRFASVLIRSNFLSCLLPYMMRTNYLLYYFAPLVTFWFTVIYFTMKLGQSKNRSLSFLLSKIAISAAILIAIVKTPGVLEQAFIALKRTCQIDWDVKEWRFRVLLDAYIVYAGMLAGVSYVKLNEALSHTSDSPIFLFICRHLQILRIIIINLAVLTIPAFLTLSYYMPDKFRYCAWHPFISVFPVLSYVVLRNAHHQLRAFHSSIFAWLGRCSLETFILQYHIWLAGDTKGLLSIGVFGTTTSGRHLDCLVLTVVFLWVSSHVATTTGILTSWIVDPKFGRTEVLTEDGESMPEYLSLPRIKTHEKLHDDRPPKAVTSVWAECISMPSKVAKDDLRLRLLLILLVMWFCNWTYT